MRLKIPGTVLLLILPLVLFGQTAPAQPAPIPPPWLLHSSNFLITLFNLKGEDVQKLLPPGITVKANDSGMVVAGLEMYVTDRVYGMPTYTTAFIFVEITGHDSPSGYPGHWIIWGKVDQPVALANFQHHFGLPYDAEPNLSVSMADGMHVGSVGAPGAEVVKMKIAPLAEPGMNIEGSVNVVGKNATGVIVRTEIPWFSTWQKGTLVTYEITPRGNSALELIKSAQPFFVVTSINQIFSYSKPVQ